jgi:hypothetical protein
LKRSDEVSEVAREDRPDESGKNPVTLSKALLIGREEIKHLNRLEVGRLFVTDRLSFNRDDRPPDISKS